MSRIIAMTLVFGTMGLTAAGVAGAQDRASGSAPGPDPAAVRTGGALFRERCAECHGSDAKGVTGHDLTRLWTSGATDERVFQIIRSGVPNTIMPSSSAPDEELRSVVRYLRNLNDAAIAGAATPETSRGTSTSTGVLDINHGEAVFWSTCGSCH